MGGDDIACGVDTSIRVEPRCFDQTPEVSAKPAYTLHFVEFDDQGWLYPGRRDEGYVAEMGSANEQLDRAVKYIASGLAKNERVLLLVYVHGWKHSAAYDDRDVKRFRQMLSNAAYLDERMIREGRVENARRRSVLGIYVGWRGAGRFSQSNPLVYLTFWTRTNAALHISEGAPRGTVCTYSRAARALERSGGRSTQAEDRRDWSQLRWMGGFLCALAVNS
jgi:hypothetical protein